MEDPRLGSLPDAPPDMQRRWVRDDPPLEASVGGRQPFPCRVASGVQREGAAWLLLVVVAGGLPASLPSLKKSVCGSGASGMWRTDSTGDRALFVFPGGHPGPAIATPHADPEQCLQLQSAVQPLRLLGPGSSEPTCPPLLETAGIHFYSVLVLGELSLILALPSPWADLQSLCRLSLHMVCEA